MNRINRRRFIAVTSVAATSAVLVACGNEPLSDEALNPTQIPDVPGAPPTIAPKTSTPGVDTGAGGDTGGGDSGGGAAPAGITIEAHDDFTFSPKDVEVAPGQTVTVVNKGFMQHDLVSKDLGVGTELLNPDGGSEDIVIPEDAEVGETFKFICTVAGHEQSGMFGSFIIVDAGAAPAGDGEATQEAATDEGAAAGSAEAITIEANDDFSFTPKDVEVAPGQTVTVVNKGFMQHDLVSNDLGVGTELLNNGETQDIVIPEDAEVGETFKFICTVAGHEQSGMFGSFTIVEGSGAAAPAGDGEATEEAATDEGAAAGGSAEPITIKALDSFQFEPKDVEVAPGQTITVVNEGFMQHDLVSDDLGIGTELLNNGQTQDIVIPEDAAVGETFKFICTVAGHEQSGMFGSFTIVEGSGAAAPAGDGEATEEAATEEAGSGESAATGSGEAITIKALDSFQFDPKDVEVTPGQTVTVVNEGFMQHDLVSNDLGVGTELLNNGESQDIVIPADAAVGETFKFICTVAGHEQSGMFGSFTIVEGSGAAAPAGDGEAATAETEETAAATPAAENDPMATTVVGTQWKFEPAEFEMAPGGVITFQNDTDMLMGLSSEEWDQNALTPMIKSVAAGKTGEFTVPEDAEVGSVIEFKSNLSEAEKQGMVGKVTIVAADGAGASPVASGDGAVVEVAMLDAFKYEPADFEVAVGDTIRFTNEGYMQHDAKVDAWGDEPITPMMNNGETYDFVVPDTAESGQTYEYYCTVAGHKQSGMVGNITVK